MVFEPLRSVPKRTSQRGPRDLSMSKRRAVTESESVPRGFAFHYSLHSRSAGPNYPGGTKHLVEGCAFVRVPKTLQHVGTADLEGSRQVAAEVRKQREFRVGESTPVHLLPNSDSVAGYRRGGWVGHHATLIARSEGSVAIEVDQRLNVRTTGVSRELNGFHPAANDRFLLKLPKHPNSGVVVIAIGVFGKQHWRRDTKYQKQCEQSNEMFNDQAVNGDLSFHWWNNSVHFLIDWFKTQ
jgi:hypothetical protein